MMSSQSNPTIQLIIFPYGVRMRLLSGQLAYRQMYVRVNLMDGIQETVQVGRHPPTTIS